MLFEKEIWQGLASRAGANEKPGHTPWCWKLRASVLMWVVTGQYEFQVQAYLVVKWLFSFGSFGLKTMALITYRFLICISGSMLLLFIGVVYVSQSVIPFFLNRKSSVFSFLNFKFSTRPNHKFTKCISTTSTPQGQQNTSHDFTPVVSEMCYRGSEASQGFPNF